MLTWWHVDTVLMLHMGAAHAPRRSRGICILQPWNAPRHKPWQNATTTTTMLYSLANNGKLSGRADGNVYNRNGVIRGMTIPRLVQNAKTATQRTNFGSLNSGWRSLTAGQQATWNAASGFTTKDRFGNTVVLVGKTLYVALNRALLNAGQAAITSAPSAAGTTPPLTMSANGSLAAGHFKLTYTTTPVPAGNTWVIFATAPQGAGIFRPGKSKYRLVSTIAAAAASPQDKTVAYNAIFGAPVAGQKVFGKAVAVNNTTGEQSAPFLFSVIVTA